MRAHAGERLHPRPQHGSAVTRATTAVVTRVPFASWLYQAGGWVWEEHRGAGVDVTRPNEKLGFERGRCPCEHQIAARAALEIFGCAGGCGVLVVVVGVSLFFNM